MKYNKYENNRSSTNYDDARKDDVHVYDAHEKPIAIKGERDLVI